MLYFLFSLPYLLIVAAMIADLLQQLGVIKTRFDFREDFMLSSTIVEKVLTPVVFAWIISSVLGFIFPPIGVVSTVISLVAFVIAWKWLHQCYKADKVSVWFNK